MLRFNDTQKYVLINALHTAIAVYKEDSEKFKRANVRLSEQFNKQIHNAQLLIEEIENDE